MRGTRGCPVYDMNMRSVSMLARKSVLFNGYATASAYLEMPAVRIYLMVVRLAASRLNPSP